jgi:methionine-S-sulfoxide reductase
LETEVGYAGGESKEVTYEEVCQKNTGHAEVIKLFFDDEKISYGELVRFFFKIHNPTTLNSQGPDFGSQYRSVIFYTNEEQKIVAEKIKEELMIEKNVVTQIIPKTTYIVGEEYHQKYLARKGVKTCG